MKIRKPKPTLITRDSQRHGADTQAEMNGRPNAVGPSGLYASARTMPADEISPIVGKAGKHKR